MILVDTSVWIHHLKVGDVFLVQLLQNNQVATHPFVEGELLLAGAPVRDLLGGVSWLAQAPHAEVRDWVAGLGPIARKVGWVDVHLAYTSLIADIPIRTYDGGLRSFREAVGRSG